MKLPMHLRASGENTRIGQFWSLCISVEERVGSNGQVGDIWSTEDLEEATCAYCQLAYFQQEEMGSEGIVPEIHWSVHPVYERKGWVRFQHWAAACGPLLDTEEYHVMATRDLYGVTCGGCLDSLGD